MYIKVLVQPGAKKEKIARPSADHFVIAVKEPAERNAANSRVLEIVAVALGVPKRAVKIISGHHSRNKIFSIENEENYSQIQSSNFKCQKKSKI